MAIHLVTKSDHSRRRAVAVLVFVVCVGLFAPRGSKGKGPCEDPGASSPRYNVPAVRVLTELTDTNGQKVGKREVAPGEFTEVCVGLRPVVPPGVPDEGSFQTSVDVKVEQAGLGFSQAHCRRQRRNWPCAAMYGFLPPRGAAVRVTHLVQPPPDLNYYVFSRVICNLDVSCNTLRMHIGAPYSWAPPFPDEGSLLYRPEEPDVGYYCCLVRIAPESRPGEYTIGCQYRDCDRDVEQCERLDLCGPLGSPYEGRCCCPWRCAGDTLRVVPCVGDCERDGQVTVDEVQRGVLVALGLEAYSTCAAADGNEDGQVTVDELVRSVSNVMSSCVETARQEREAAQNSLAQTGGNGPAETKPALSLQGQSLEDADEDTPQ